MAHLFINPGGSKVFQNSPGPPRAPYQAEPSPHQVFLALPPRPPSTTLITPKHPFRLWGRGGGRHDGRVIPESVRSGSRSRWGSRFGSSPVSSAGNIPKRCQCQSVPCSLLRPHLPALRVCPQEDAGCSPGQIMGCSWSKDTWTTSHQLQLWSFVHLPRFRFLNT